GRTQDWVAISRQHFERIGEMALTRYMRPVLMGTALMGLPVVTGCCNSPIDVSDYRRGPAPLREPAAAHCADACCYEDALEGGHIFEMYCAACHNARALAERPFSNYQNAAQHMRVRANFTGKEYAKLMEFLRRWHDIPNPEQHEVTTPKRFFFSQPIAEMR